MKKHLRVLHQFLKVHAAREYFELPDEQLIAMIREHPQCYRAAACRAVLALREVEALTQ